MTFRRLCRNFSYKVYKKANTYIVPTTSYNASSTIPIEDIVPKHFNLSKSEVYSSKLAQEAIDPELHKPDTKHVLYKLEIETEPNFEELMKFIHYKKAENIIYLNIKSEHYIYLSKLIEKEKELRNLVITIDNPKLNETELMELYETVSHPINIGLTSHNVQNFKETETETAIRRFLKEMFRFYNHVKLIELDCNELQQIINKGDTTKKTADLNTIIDFTLMAEFKGYLEISLDDIKYNDCKDQCDNLRQCLDEIDKKLIERGFTFGTIESKVNLLELLNNVKPADDFLTFMRTTV